MTTDYRYVEYLVVDSTAFIQNENLHEAANNIITCKEVVDEITNKRQLRRLVVLPYDLIVKDAFPEYIKIVSDFSKKTGDYPSLSATDIKVIALTYQLEKEKVGVSHLRTVPVSQKPLINTDSPVQEVNPNITGFFIPAKDKSKSEDEYSQKYGSHELNQKTENVEIIIKSDNNTEYDNIGEVIQESSGSCDQFYARFQALNCSDKDLKSDEDVLMPVRSDSVDVSNSGCISSQALSDGDDDASWITPSNVKKAQKQVNSQLKVEKRVEVACMTTDFAMQNVLKQMGLNVCALDGRIIKQLRTYILRCYSCFKTTSLMNKMFCPKCGNNTLKKVAVSVGEQGEMHIHINARKPLTGKGKRKSLPRIKGGKHPNNPLLVADQPVPDNRPSRLARITNNPLDDDYIAGFSPFIMRDVNSKAAQLGISIGFDFKQWMKKNPNKFRCRRK